MIISGRPTAYTGLFIKARGTDSLTGALEQSEMSRMRVVAAGFGVAGQMFAKRIGYAKGQIL